MAPSAAELFDRHHRTVFRYLNRLSNRRDVAEDLTQDVFLRAVQAIASYRDEERELHWLIRIARNRFIDYVRGLTARPRAADVEPTSSIHPPQVVSINLREALATLDPLDRDVFLLRELTGLSYTEISDVCGLTPDAVRSRIYRARHALRAQLFRPTEGSVV
jgi:RNA polymerase sigma-70 factor, ECF subfamily